MVRVVGDRWCILRTAGVRTLRLAASLRDAGMEAWTPIRKERRAGRGRQRKELVEQEVAITPSFVFVRSHHLGDLLRARAAPVSEHPTFSILRYGDRIPEIADASLAALRAAEERFRRSFIKNVRRKLDVGSSVQMKTGAFTGMTGTVKIGRHGKHVVDLGGIWSELDIASYLIGTDMVQVSPSSELDIAA